MATASAQKATERIAVLLRPREKRTLDRLARKEKVSAGELIRRSLSVYAELDAMAQSGKLAEAEAALDRTLASIQEARTSIQFTLSNIEQQHQDPAFHAAQDRLDQIVAAASHRGRIKPAVQRDLQRDAA